MNQCSTRTRGIVSRPFLSLGLFSMWLIACGADSSSGAGVDDSSDSDDSGSGPGFAVPGAGASGGSGGAAAPPAEGPTPEMVCGQETTSLERLPAELLLVLDRSSSMVSDRLRTGQTHWDVTTSAVNASLRSTEQGVLWGLKMFPSSTGCQVNDGVERDVAQSNHMAISDLVERARPGSRNGTPTTAAMNAARAHLSARTTPNPKYILLATDGEPTCLNGNASRTALDIDNAIASVAAAAEAGIHTFVVGIAAQRQSGQALQTLNAMAEAGKEPRAGDTKFFSVTSEEELTLALNAIAGQVGSCSFPLKKLPPSPNEVYVEVDGKRIPRSDTEGWQYGANGSAIVLTGALCERAKAGELKDVRFTFGCPGMVVL